ncbi:MAG TPA: cellulase family glycosylhydrolase [Candidatus Saccharimonadales bacterium]|nr:cellulase family glycosylhydrolase [Candidatus Saccharimonadales bacterium]
MPRFDNLKKNARRIVRPRSPRQVVSSVVKRRGGKWQLYVALIVLIAILGLAGYQLYVWLAAPSVQSTSSCDKARGPFVEKGTEILQSDGKVYTPYGITISGLSSADYQRYTVYDDSEIIATADNWCSNTVRFQVAQDNLVGPTGDTYSSAFMNAINSEVKLAEKLGLVVVLNAQTETVGHETGPTQATVRFWDDIVNLYGKDPRVVLDLFNEPRIYSANGPLVGNPGRVWQLWQDGGTYHGVTYVGMQTLLSNVRSEGATNLVWVEGPYADTSLSGVDSHLLTGGPLMYSIHHPYGPHNAATWNADFGFLVNRHIAPVVVGEWTNYASTRNECWPDARTAIPSFLDYLADENIGLNAWSLHPGVLIASPSFTSPTHIRANYACKNSLDQGAGFQLFYWFRELNSTTT